jgi:photosystem II stability/assembly factor-like uncharacterized protein
MHSSVTPYVSGVPVKSDEAFYGREDIFRFVQETLAAPEQNVVVLFGPWRMGKTSILRQLPNRLSNGFYCVFFDMQGRANQRVSKVLYDLATAIAHSLGMVSPSAASFEDEGRYFLEHFLPSAYAQLEGKQLLLLLDDFDALAEEASPAKGTASAELFPILGQLISNKTHLAFVFVVGHRVEELPSRLQRLLRQGHHKHISFLNHQNAVQLVTELAKGELKYTAEAIKAILDVTRGHPYFTQVLCSEVFDHAQRMNTKEVTVKDIRTVINNERVREKLAPLTSQTEEVAVPPKREEEKKVKRRPLLTFLTASVGVLLLALLAVFFAAKGLFPKPETPTPTQIAAVTSPTVTAPPTMTATPEPSATNTPTVIPTTAIPTMATATETPTATSTPVPPIVTPISTETPTPTPTLSPTPTPTPTQAPIPKPLGSLSVWDVDINPRNTKEVYAVVEGRGIYKTIDGGLSWVLIVGQPYYTIECLTVDPKDPRILYAGLWEGILKSTDGGANWKAITAPTGSGLPLKETVHTLAVVPDNPHAVYAGTGGGAYKSLDQGQTWEARNKGMGGISIYHIIMTSGNGERAYAAGEGAEIYQTVDGGSSPWTKLSCTYCGRGATSLAVHPDNERIVYVGDDKTQLGKSTDGGHTWELLTPSFQYSDLRISALVMDPKNPDIIYAGTGDRANLANDGIYKSTDGGKTWKSINAGLPRDPSERHYSILTIAIDPNDSQTIYAGGFGGLYRSTGGGDSWVQQ